VTTLIVIAKAPLPGRVKTRLCPPFTPDQAAALAEASLRDCLHAVASARADHRLLALDGEPGGWLPPGFTVVAQVAGTLDLRLAGAFAAAGRADPGPALLIGMDTPQVDPAQLDDALAAMAGPPGLNRADAVFGPAEDGGFWALGLREPAHPGVDALLRGVPMSRPDTGRFQYDRLTRAGLRISVLPPLCDVDTASDAHAVAAQAPDSEFARQLALIGRTGVATATATATGTATGTGAGARAAMADAVTTSVAQIPAQTQPTRKDPTRPAAFRPNRALLCGVCELAPHTPHGAW
jgi:uncharacterized protein